MSAVRIRDLIAQISYVGITRRLEGSGSIGPRYGSVGRKKKVNKFINNNKTKIGRERVNNTGVTVFTYRR